MAGNSQSPTLILVLMEVPALLLSVLLSWWEAWRPLPEPLSTPWASQSRRSLRIQRGRLLVLIFEVSYVGPLRVFLTNLSSNPHFLFWLTFLPNVLYIFNDFREFKPLTPRTNLWGVSELRFLFLFHFVETGSLCVVKTDIQLKAILYLLTRWGSSRNIQLALGFKLLPIFWAS